MPLLVAIVLAAGVAGCSTAAASFSPTGPCTVDGREPGAYPTLEALVPKHFDGRSPTTLDSGRNCTAENLGTLTGHNVTELRFAGATWQDTDSNGITLAVFQAPGLDPSWIGEWYEASARAGQQTTGFTPTRPTIDGRQAYRLDLLNDETPQTVIVWPSADGSVTQVVLAAGESEARIQLAIHEFP